MLLQGQIAAGGELLKGHRFRISVEERYAEGMGATIVEILDSTGSQLTPRVVDDSGSGTATVTFVADATARYYLEVSAFDPNATGIRSADGEHHILDDPAARNYLGSWRRKHVYRRR